VWTILGDGAYELVRYVAHEDTTREDAIFLATGIFTKSLDPLPDDLIQSLAAVRARTITS
jgi:hypothetical protein